MHSNSVKHEIRTHMMSIVMKSMSVILEVDDKHKLSKYSRKEWS